MKRSNRPERREARWEEALARQAARAERTPAEQIALVEARGHPNCAEIQRLKAANG